MRALDAVVRHGRDGLAAGTRETHAAPRVTAVVRAQQHSRGVQFVRVIIAVVVVVAEALASLSIIRPSVTVVMVMLSLSLVAIVPVGGGGELAAWLMEEVQL